MMSVSSLAIGFRCGNSKDSRSREGMGGKVIVLSVSWPPVDAIYATPSPPLQLTGDSKPRLHRQPTRESVLFSRVAKVIKARPTGGISCPNNDPVSTLALGVIVVG